VPPATGWSLCTGVKLKGTAVTGVGLRLLDIALGDAILVSLAILDLSSDSGWVATMWVKNPGRQ